MGERRLGRRFLLLFLLAEFRERGDNSGLEEKMGNKWEV